MAKKIGDKIEIEFWDRLELKLKIGRKKLNFKGWQAALMRELIINGAAMTVDGAREFIQADGLYEIGSETVIEFLFKQHDEGWLKTHEETMMKDKTRKRMILSSAIKRKFRFQIIVHEEEK